MKKICSMDFCLFLCLAGGTAFADTPPKDRPYPPKAMVSRIPTAIERALAVQQKNSDLRTPTVAPTGPVHCVAEYEPMEAMLLAWKGPPAWQEVLAEMTARITTTGNADVYMAVNDSVEQTAATTALIAHGVNMTPETTRVNFVKRPTGFTTDTIWMRDYGPRYIYEGTCRAIVDHAYNISTRVNDDAFPLFFAGLKLRPYYEYPLYHAGGNFQLDALNRAYATRLIANDNPSFTEADILGIWQAYMNVSAHLFEPLPGEIDFLQHLDMWMQIIADNKVVISNWPNNSGSPQDVVCDSAALYMAGQGYTVYRTPAYSVFVSGIGNVHYTYTNAVICNNLVMVPSYTNPSVSGQNGAAANVFAGAMPGKTVVQIPGEDLVYYGGVLHSITMPVPKHKGVGGVKPTIYLKNWRGGQILPSGGSPMDFRWITDDDQGTISVDIHMSTDGGQTFDSLVVSNTEDDGLYFWAPPNYCNQGVRFRVTVRDASGNTGSDSSDSDLFMTGTAYPPGDCNCDCHRDIRDLPAFIVALIDPLNFNLVYPDCPLTASDFDASGFVNGIDLKMWVDAILP